MAINRRRSTLAEGESSPMSGEAPSLNALPQTGRRDPYFERKREAIIQSIIGSQALEGVHLTYEEVARLVDEVRDEPRSGDV